MIRSRCVGAGVRLATVAAALLGTVVGLGPAPPAAEAQTPSTITLHGHGWGHGRGMGQYGAEGYATMFGWSAAQILGHFYGGTNPGTVPNDQIAVRLVARDGLELHVTAGVPFRVAGYDLAPGMAVVVRADGPSAYSIRGESSCGANDHPWVAVPGYVSITPLEPSGDDLSRMLRLCGGASYRGELVLVHAEGSMRTTNVVHLEDYVRGVVPQESPSWFHPAALQAQAVAARSYAMASGGEFGNQYSYAKTCDTISCQVYRGAGLGGTRYETAAADAAVAATAGVVRRFTSGTLARTEFSSSTGGWTAGGAFPAVEDLGDSVPSNGRHRWTRNLATADLAARYGVGAFRSLTIIARNGLGEWGGRVLSLRVTGSTGSVTLTGNEFRTHWSLFSDWFTTDANDGPGAASSNRSAGADVVARGADGQIRLLPQGAGAWTTLGGVGTSDPDAASPGDGTLAVVVRGSDGGLYVAERTGAGSPFSGWSGIGGLATSSPSIVSWGPGRLDVFVRGTDGAVWTRSRVSGTWSSWTSLGGLTDAAPDVASQAPGSLNLFIRGRDGQLWHRPFDGTWRPWEPLGGALTSGPGAAARPGRVDVVVRAADASAWIRTWTGGWGSWSPLDGTFASDLDVAVGGSTGIDVVGRGIDGAVWRRTLRATWSTWHTLGVPG